MNDIFFKHKKTMDTKKKKEVEFLDSQVFKIIQILLILITLITSIIILILILKKPTII